MCRSPRSTIATDAGGLSGDRARKKSRRYKKKKADAIAATMETAQACETNGQQQPFWSGWRRALTHQVLYFVMCVRPSLGWYLSIKK